MSGARFVAKNREALRRDAQNNTDIVDKFAEILGEARKKHSSGTANAWMGR